MNAARHHRIGYLSGCFLAVFIFIAGPADAADFPARENGACPKRGAVTILGGDWGGARTTQVQAVLCEVFSEIAPFFPQRAWRPILVRSVDDQPMFLFSKGPRGEYQIALTARGDNGPGLAYEFAHELGHALADGARHGAGSPGAHQWFEEALCEALSLFVLRRMGDRQDGLLRTSAENAAAFRAYADGLFNESHRRLSGTQTLQRWLVENEPRLQRDPYLRHKNEVVANLVLPIFEADPAHWRALAYLHSAGSDTSADFREYLDRWLNSSPEQYRGAISAIIRLFESPEEPLMRAGL